MNQDIDQDFSNPIRKEFIDSLIKMMELKQKKEVNDFKPILFAISGAVAFLIINKLGPELNHLVDIISERTKQFYRNNPSSKMEPEDVVEDILKDYLEREKVKHNILPLLNKPKGVNKRTKSIMKSDIEHGLERIMNLNL